MFLCAMLLQICLSLLISTYIRNDLIWGHFHQKSIEQKIFIINTKTMFRLALKEKKAHLEATVGREQCIIKLYVQKGKNKSNWWSHKWSCVSLVLNLTTDRVG